MDWTPTANGGLIVYTIACGFFAMPVVQWNRAGILSLFNGFLDASRLMVDFLVLDALVVPGPPALIVYLLAGTSIVQSV